MARDLKEYRVAKAAPGRNAASDAKAWEQTGLDTLVVHAVNDVYLEVVALSRGFQLTRKVGTWGVRGHPIKTQMN